jgi:hypothetical protein
MSQRQQHDSPCCKFNNSAMRRFKLVQNRLKFATVQADRTTPADYGQGYSAAVASQS